MKRRAMAARAQGVFYIVYIMAYGNKDKSCLRTRPRTIMQIM